ncbi:hypothetical protein JCM11251_006807 [Rhodosporidiobolus azoricus]
MATPSTRADYAAPSSTSASASRSKSRRAPPQPADPGYSNDSQLSHSDGEVRYAGGGDTGGAAPLVKASRKEKADKSRGDYAAISDRSSASRQKSKNGKKSKSKKSTPAVAAHSDGDEESNVGGYDYGTPIQQQDDESGGGGDAGKSSKKWWYIGGGVVVVLIIIIAVVVYLMNKDSDSSATDKADSTAASALDDEESSSTASGLASGSKSASSTGHAGSDASSSGATVAPAAAWTGSSLDDLDASMSSLSGDKSGGSAHLSTSTGFTYVTASLDTEATTISSGSGMEELLTLAVGNDTTSTAIGTSVSSGAIGGPSSGRGAQSTGGMRASGDEDGMSTASADEIYINPLQSTSSSNRDAPTMTAAIPQLTSAPVLYTNGLSYGGMDASTIQTFDEMVTNSEGKLAFTSFPHSASATGPAASDNATFPSGFSAASDHNAQPLPTQSGTGGIDYYGGGMINGGQNDTESFLQDGNDKFLTPTPLTNMPSTGPPFPTAAASGNEPIFSIQTVPNPTVNDQNGDGGFAYSYAGLGGFSFAAPSSTAAVSSGSAQQTGIASPGPNGGKMGKAIFYSEINWVGSCGVTIEADSPVIALPLSIYPEVTEPSSLCGEEVMVRNPANGQMVTLHVAGASNRSSYTLLPASIFQQIGGALADGEMDVQFRFLDGSLRIEGTEVEPDKGKYEEGGGGNGSAGEGQMGEVHEGKFWTKLFSFLRPHKQAVYYTEVDWTGACGEVIKADSLTLGLPLSIYGDPSAASPLCGAEVIMRNPGTGQKVTLHVASPSEDERLELPAAVYQSLGGALNAGEVDVQWRFVDGTVEIDSSRTEQQGAWATAGGNDSEQEDNDEGEGSQHPGDSWVEATEGKEKTMQWLADPK